MQETKPKCFHLKLASVIPQILVQELPVYKEAHLSLLMVRLSCSRGLIASKPVRGKSTQEGHG